LKVSLVLGTRPQIIKSAPFIHLAMRYEGICLDIIHTGQHYDYEMTKIFFEELQLPDPVANLNVRGGTHAWQTARIMLGLEKVLGKERPDLVIVPGDTNSTLAGALTASKLHIPLAHVEAGARSYDLDMPEEINRRLTDHCSTLLFTPTENCTANVIKEGIDESAISQAGDTMYDVLLQQLPRAERTEILRALDLEPKSYMLLTAHRAENVDSPERMANIVKAAVNLQWTTVVFPVHPRTKKQLHKFNLARRLTKQIHLKIVEPLGYHELIKLIKDARLVLTDSGGIQKEAFWLGTPCLTLRETTEWPETVKLGGNTLVGADTNRILSAVRKTMKNEEDILRKLEDAPNPFGDGRASERIVRRVRSFLS